MKSMKWIAWMAAGIALAGCKREANNQFKQQRPEAIPVRVVAVTNASWDKTVTIIGTLYPKDEATLAAQVEGSVERTLVDFGDRVKQDQDLAYVDTAAYDAQLEQTSGNLAKAEANLKNAQQNFERTKKLREDKIASESDYDMARAQLDQWDAEVKAAKGAEGIARLNLDRSRCKAPFDGAISQRIVGRGDYVKAGSPLFNMVNDSVLKFIFQVPERYASYVQKQLPVTFTVDNYPGETFTGSVYLISPAVSTASRSFNVGALVTNTDFRLKANTFGRGVLVLERSVPTPVVPVDSIVTFAGVEKVFVIENNVARSRTVQTGRIQNGVQEILQGVRPGEAVVVTGQTRLVDGNQVVVQGEVSPSVQGTARTGVETRAVAATQ